MTREHKLALIVGFSLVLVVGILISDHLSPASLDEPLETLSFKLPLAEPEPFVVTSPRQPTTEPLPREESRQEPVSDPGQAGTGSDQVEQHPEPQLPEQRTVPGPIEIVQGNARPIGNGSAGNTGTPNLPGFTRVPPEETIPLTSASVGKYMVQKGDTVAGLARRFLGDDDRWPEIQALNPDRITKDGQVREGVTLKIPGSGSGLVNQAPEQRRPDPKPTRTPAAPPATGGKRTYVVQAKDTLSQIAQRELGSSKRMEEILKLNKDKIDNPDEIYEGLKLVLPSA